MNSPAQILANVDDFILSSNRGFFYKMCGIIRNMKFLLPFLPAEINNIIVKDNDGEYRLSLVSKESDLTSSTVVNGTSYLLFHEHHIGKRFEIDAWSQNRTLNWNWFVNTESVLSNYKRRLDFSICSGLNVYKESGTHNLIITPGMVKYDAELYTTPEIISDLRPDIANIPPRGSMLKVFFISRDNVAIVSEDMVIYDFTTITLFLGEGEKKESYDSIISEKIYQLTDNDRNDLSYLEVARIWIKDFLHRPPALEITYDLHSRRPNFLNWSI